MKDKFDDQFYKYLIIGNLNETVVLEYQNNQGKVKIQQSKQTPLQSDTQTIHLSNLSDNSWVQITPTGILHISSGKRNLWKCDRGIITHAVSNEKQVVIALDTSEVIYFELDNLNQLAEIGMKQFDS